MGIKNTELRKIPPTHPGEMLREDLMPDYKLVSTKLAEALGVSRQTVNELLRERRYYPDNGTAFVPVIR